MKEKEREREREREKGGRKRILPQSAWTVSRNTNGMTDAAKTRARRVLFLSLPIRGDTYSSPRSTWLRGGGRLLFLPSGEDSSAQIRDLRLAMLRIGGSHPRPRFATRCEISRTRWRVNRKIRERLENEREIHLGSPWRSRAAGSAMDIRSTWKRRCAGMR